jgi:hypothetical protein
MRLSCMRFTVQRLMVAVALASVLIMPLARLFWLSEN